ncbi:peptidoglycan DD-metalloendopeptidase family protein [Variovorax sp. J22P168]|uniref:murein hydrolase activator EnvC family protein n=1 Tax=Variovorax jilinensis TaxID=3053513 RepID=UPI002574AFBD|nr:peptidoglycan DD-metalloendopeptidase family protein [Variovorax sp. J22P168]MDM0012490.1 peptidoglycan DD-metalloendopeptidase family protein [Variovorax sp. J22P168]
MDQVKTSFHPSTLLLTATRFAAASLLSAALIACGTATKPAPGSQSTSKAGTGSRSVPSQGSASGSPSSRPPSTTPGTKADGAKAGKDKAPKSASKAPRASPGKPAPAAGALAGTFVWPASGTVTARFDGASNKGIDIAGRPGDPVLAASAGRVVFAGSTMRGYGNLVMLRHGDNLLTAYAHNRKLLVKENENVKAGQKIAEMGNSDSNATKLHFEVRRAGQAVDPMPYLGSQGAAPAP